MKSKYFRRRACSQEAKVSKLTNPMNPLDDFWGEENNKSTILVCGVA
jgi:hypothetical protein